jgi:monoterpene epsilon-lactone hydrolase
VRMRRAFATETTHARMGGVAVDVVTPVGGVRPDHRDKVLINMHGGAFMWGAGAGALLEAIPIAATGGYKVVAVDYRLAPEHHYPAASEDAAAVYRELLKTYRPENIGIYGCSAGGMLTAQATAWFQTHGLPRPGAIGTFCGSGIAFTGDSTVLGAAAAGERPSPDAARNDPPPIPYLTGVPASDPEAYPANAPAVLARFPPTLLITGSRDFAQSAETTMQRRLTAAGIDARLFVFDGMPHAFFIFPDMPESHEVYGLICSFFDQHLGRRPPT